MRERRESGEARKPDRQAGLDPAFVEGMRAAGRCAAAILDAVEREIRPGLSTGDIDRLVDAVTSAFGATSAPLGYRGFPAHCCTSPNDVICHGIPDDRCRLRDGDIVNVDVTPIVNGFHGDASRTFLIGAVSPLARRLVGDTYEALWRGVAAVRPGGRTGDIGAAIQRFAEARGYSVVRDFTGHGIGRRFHEPPAVFHYGTPGAGELLLPGMTFTVEPMINAGQWQCRVLDDGWTAVTADGSLSAQFEHTLLVTASGVEVLTLGAHESPRPVR